VRAADLPERQLLTQASLLVSQFPLPRTAAVLARLAKETNNNNETRPKPIVLTAVEVAEQEKLQEEQIKQRVLAREEANAPHGKKGNNGKRKASGQAPNGAAPADEDLDEMMNDAPAAPAPAPVADGLVKDTTSIDTARIRPSEKRRLNWKGELYLAPLTTTGNLPFRKLCSTFGSDIHCGEMGLAESYLQGNSSEWSLVRRWEGERIFGTQLCGSKPELLVPVAEALYKECGPNGLDFVDLNCGCPIDMVYNKGAGSALMDHAGRLGKILRGMSAVLGEIPVTIKMRTGTSNKVNTAHKLFARVQTEFGVGAATLHGRSRQQRYKNLADWNYIKQCTETLRNTVREHNESAFTADEEEMAPIPIYGNGDVYSYEDYYANIEHTGVDGEMIARGALIKPWLFTEIKEKRTWDISSRERLDMVRQYASYGLTHWGSDTAGVNLTRRFLCEAMSFWHRYVPVGILEYLPPRMNDRPPVFKGRDELETYLASGNAQDWVKISEMFLGKAPEDWNFIREYRKGLLLVGRVADDALSSQFAAKHKSNSFNDSGADQQG
jgi:tRNA-dihydrouridine synthase 3